MSVDSESAAVHAEPAKLPLLAERELDPIEFHEPPRLPKHSYPIGVVAAAVLTIVAAAYSFTRAPSLVSAGRELHSGQAALAHHNYAIAVEELQRAHKEVPSSRKATILLAEADFGAHHDGAGLLLLRGMRLTQSEWSTLTKTMPPSVQAFFGPAS